MSQVPNTAPTDTPPIQVSKARLMWNFFVWVITLGGLLLLPFSRFGQQRNHFRAEESVVYSIHDAFYLWPIIFVGFIGATIVQHAPSTASYWGWVYAWTVLLVFLAITVNIDTIKLIVWGALIGFVWIASKYLQELKHIPVLALFITHIRMLNPKLEPGLVSVISWMLIGPWIAALFHSFSRGRNTFSPNGIESWRFGEGTEVTDRMGLHFVCHYDDLIEFVFSGGGGDVIALDNQNNQVKKRWENIPFLFFRWHRLEGILEQRASVIDNAETDPVEVEEVTGVKRR